MPKIIPDSDQKLSLWQKATLLFLAIISGIIIAYDVIVAFFNQAERDTVSRIIQLMAYENWSFAFAFGALFVGHFFIPGRPLLPQPWGFLSLVAIAVTIYLGIDLQGLSFKLHPLVFVGIGATAGRLFWPMSAL